MNLHKNELALFLMVFVFYLIIILSFLGSFRLDEGSYALMIKDLAEHPSHITPEIGGEHVEWKPPLFFWIYGFFYYFLKNLSFLPIETIFRIPSALFGALNIVLLFRIGKQLYDEKIAFMSVIFYSISPVAIVMSTLNMMEALAVFFFLFSFYYYINKKTWQALFFLALLTQVKWLYTAALVVLLLIYFWKEHYKIKVVRSAMIGIALSLGIHLILCIFTGSFQNALYNYLVTDLGRITPFTIEIIIENLYQLIFMTGALIPLLAALVLLLGKRVESHADRVLIGAIFLLFILPFTGTFLYWYSSPLFPFASILIAVVLSKEPLVLSRILFVIVILVFLVHAAIVFLNIKSLMKDVKELSQIVSKSKNAVFYATRVPRAWAGIEQRYLGSKFEYLLVEPFAPGFLFYTQNNENIPSLKLKTKNTGPDLDCEVFDLVIIDNWLYPNKELESSLPSCFKRQGTTKNKEYIIYKKGN